MFAYIKGVLSEKSPSAVVIETAGIGYDIKIPLSTFEQLPELNGEVKLYIHVHYTQEDGNRLFGFYTPAEKELFRMLISISRIGPRIGLSVLSTMSVNDIVMAILNNNYKVLSSAPGLGTKSAQRLIIELKDKVRELEMSPTESKDKSLETDSRFSEAESALTTLGFKPFEIFRAFKEVTVSKNASTQEIIKTCIKYLYQKRNES